MKKVIFFGLIISLMILSCAKQESKFPQGVWQLVQTQTVGNGVTIVGFPVNWSGSMIKMWSEKHWTNVDKSIRYYTMRKDMYAGGTYTLEGNQYEEQILYHNNKDYEGRISANMTLELRNDTLIQSYHPLGSDGHVVESVSNIEKYIRLE